MRSGFLYIVCVWGIKILSDISKADVVIDVFFFMLPPIYNKWPILHYYIKKIKKTILLTIDNGIFACGNDSTLK